MTEKPKGGRDPLPESERKLLVGVYLHPAEISKAGGKAMVRKLFKQHIQSTTAKAGKTKGE